MNLTEQIKIHIKHHGFINVAQYMQLAMTHEQHGYYANDDPLGGQGDFITAPEISQIFGELIGMWLASNWEAMGSPKDTILVELGAGRGTLMSDILHATHKIPDFHNSLNIHLVEINSTLKELQKQAVAPYNIKTNHHDDCSDLPQKPMLLIANEFFDALPIHQFIKQPDGWREQIITLDSQDNFIFDMSRTPTPHCTLAPQDFTQFSDDTLYEFSPQSNVIIQQLATHIAEHGGAGLIIDYGDWSSPLKSSLQGVKSHQYHDPLRNVGEVDLSAHVNFKHLGNMALSSGAKSYLGVTQGEFLTAMGINIRAEMLKKNKDKATINSIDKAISRLTDDNQMGKLFKCLAITHQDLPAPYAFEVD